MTGTIDRCSPCVEYVLSDFIPYSTCIPITPTPVPPITPQACGGLLQGPNPPTNPPPNVNCTWGWLVNAGVQQGNVYWWYVETQTWN
jgi:hypothetical protein